MAAKRKKKDYIKIIGIILFVAIGIISMLYAEKGPWIKEGGETSSTYVDFIDCGQGDSVLLVSNGEVALIDATTGEDSQSVVDHLKSRGIKKINHFLLTHPHEDHIGGAKKILTNFDVENIYMRRPTSGTEPTTSVYLNLLKEIKRQGKKVTSVLPGSTFNSGEFLMDILGPVEDYQDLNDQSIVLKASCGKVSFLITGDQETPAEKDLVKEYGSSLKSTVLKLGHHGSRTASGNAFLNAVDPECAVVSCGRDNSYGHPHKETISRLNKLGIEYYRTDELGTITFYTDGNEVWRNLK